MKRFKKLIIIVVSLLLLAVAGYFGVNAYLKSLLEKTNTEEVEEITPEEVEVVENLGHEVVNFMLVGADNLDWGHREESYVTQRSDVFKIVSLDYTDKLIKLTSLDRDVVVWIPDKNDVGAYGHFNWAYSFGKSKYALHTINYNLDLDVSKYATFSFAGFVNVIDILDGIDIELSDGEVDVINKNPERTMDVVTGINHLDGNTALYYARIRHLDSDFNRMNRQNNVIKAVITKLKDSSFTELLSIANSCLPYITTNLSVDEIQSYLFDLVTFNLSDIKMHTYPTNGYEDVCVNKNDLGGYLVRSYSNQVIDLHKFIYEDDSYKPSQRVLDNETKTYETFGQFYDNSDLLP